MFLFEISYKNSLWLCSRGLCTHAQDANWLRVGSPQRIIKVMNFNRAIAIMYESLLKTKFECYSKRKYIYLARLGMRFYYHESLERIFKCYSQVKYFMTILLKYGTWYLNHLRGLFRWRISFESSAMLNGSWEPLYTVCYDRCFSHPSQGGEDQDVSAAWNVKMKERNSAPSSQGISSHMITRVGPQNLLLTNLETRQFKNPEDFHCGQFTPHLCCLSEFH